MVAKENWVFLVYQLPREPSTPRISVWRKLKRLGVAQVGAGVVALPYDALTKEQLEWVAQEVIDSGGDASIWITTPTSRRFGRQLAEILASERAAEYEELIRHADTLSDGGGRARKRGVDRLRAEFRRIDRRDHFPPPQRQQALRTIERLSAAIEPETAR